MGDAATRKGLFAGGKAAVTASKDSFIELARLVDARARELRTKYDNEVLGVERDAYSKIAQAVFASQGDAAYPDGTFTLRLSYGQVKGYMENGKPVTPFTEIRGLFIRGDEHKQKPPYKIADSWMKARATLNPTTPYNFVSTNDIVGGNSGSPVINVEGRAGRTDLRRQHPIAAGLLRLRRRGESRRLGRFARHARSAARRLQGELGRRRARRRKRGQDSAMK